MTRVRASLTNIVDFLDEGLRNHRSGRLADADGCYRRALAIQPGHADVLHLLGVIAHQVGQNETAVDFISRAIAINGSEAGYHSNLGNALKGLGRLYDADQAYRLAIRHDPDFAEAHANLGIVRKNQRRLKDAVAAFNIALALKPDIAETWSNLGNALRDQGKLSEAIAAYITAGRLAPDYAGARSNLGNALNEDGRFEAAGTVCKVAIVLMPGSPEPYSNLGNSLKSLGFLEAAIATYAKAVRINNDYAEAFSNCGNALCDCDQMEAAHLAYGMAVALRPDYAEAISHLGNIYHHRGQFERSAAAHFCAIRILPDFPEAHSNFATALKDQGFLEDALVSYKSALCFRPAYAEAHHNEAYIRLLRGEFPVGWSKYEWRWCGGTTHLKPRGFAQPQWGGEDISGKTILLYGEQGLGDILQFCRYGSMVAARGATVILEAPRSLRRLLSWLPGIDRLVAAGEPLPSFDFHCPLLSLPGVFGTLVGTIPAPVPYLRAEDQVREVWQNRLGATGFKIGIAWQGNPNAAAERGRSVPLADFIPLARVPGVRLISLQKGPGVEQLAELPADMPVEVLGDDFDCGPDAFIDTAAVMMALDLVITVDTAIGHLAGALGQPVWIALQAIPHWVWLLDREDSPWYPTVRLFRQSRRGDWAGVFARMAAALESDIFADN